MTLPTRSCLFATQFAPWVFLSPFEPIIHLSLRQSLGTDFGVNSLQAPPQCDMNRTASCWALFQCYLMMSSTLTTHSGHATHFHSVVPLKWSWEAVTLPSHDCRHFELYKTSNYFLKTSSGAHSGLVQSWGWSEGTSPDIWGYSPPILLGMECLL